MNSCLYFFSGGGGIHRTFDCGHGHRRRFPSCISEQRQWPRGGRAGRSLRARGHVRVLQRAVPELRSVGRAQREPGPVRASLPSALWVGGGRPAQGTSRRHVVLAVAAGVYLLVCVLRMF